MKKDWTGNSVSYSKTLGASSHSQNEREKHDYYATEPKAVRMLLEIEHFEGKIWECACGEGHLSEEMKRLGREVYSTDIVDRNYPDRIMDFLGIENNEQVDFNIITNPPYRYANEFISKALSIMPRGKKLALFLPIRYLEGKQRKAIFKLMPPKVVYVSSSRIKCAMNGDFNKMTGSAVSYAWFVWEKGHSGDTTLKWFN
jgi:hypothetical protein